MPRNESASPSCRCARPAREREPGEDLRIIEQSCGVVKCGLGQLRCQLGPPLPPPVAEQVAEEVLRRVRPEGVQGRHLGVELRDSSSGSNGPPARPDPAGRCATSQSRKGQRRPDIVLVVGGDAVESGRVVVDHVLLVLDDRRRTLVDLVSPSVAGHPLEVLEPVGLGADLHRVTDDGIEVDEEAGLDQSASRASSATPWSAVRRSRAERSVWL